MFLLSTLPDESDTEFFITFAANQNEYSFSVMACNRVQLMINRGGQNTETLYTLDIFRDELFLYQGKSVAVHRLSLDMLSCFEYRPFLLKWSNNYIDLVQSNHGGRTLLSFVVPEASYSTDNIHGLAVGNVGASDWMIPRLGSKLD